MAQHDLVLRWLERLSLLIRRLLYGPGEVDIRLAKDHLREAFRHLLGPMEELVARLDPPSAAGLLQDPDRIYAYAQLLALRAAVRRAAQHPEAEEDARRAIAMGREAVARSAEPPEAWTAWITSAETELPDVQRQEIG